MYTYTRTRTRARTTIERNVVGLQGGIQTGSKHLNLYYYMLLDKTCQFIEKFKEIIVVFL